MKPEASPTEKRCPIEACGAAIRIEETGPTRHPLIRAHEDGNGGVCVASETPPKMWA